MSELWELGLHPSQAEVHEPLTPADRDEFGHGLGELDCLGTDDYDPED